jgi:hypothetical protein
MGINGNVPVARLRAADDGGDTAASAMERASLDASAAGCRHATDTRFGQVDVVVEYPERNLLLLLFRFSNLTP